MIAVKISRVFLILSLGFFMLTHCFAFAQPQDQVQNQTQQRGQPSTQTRQQRPTPPSPPEEELGEGYPDLTTQALLLVFLALLPFLVMLLTSFIKIVITLALLRSALGVQQTPPNQVINGIALILTLYVMFPTGMEMYHRARPLLEGDKPNQIFSAPSAAFTMKLIDVTKEPLRQFLVRNARKHDLQGFYKIAYKTFPEEIKPNLKETDFIIAIPSFITTQIRAAFEIGVLIYLPFFVIDLVTSNVLLAMQMMMLSPLSISLPLKLLLVVMVDGWTLLVQGLVLSFN
jgi:type III secretion protein R